MKTDIHHNSLEAYYEGKVQLFNKRTREILSALEILGKATDRQIQEYLNLPEPNAVRPRITEAIKEGLLSEVDVTRCHITNKQVRVVAIAKKTVEYQIPLFV
jgi:DNA-binding Lrp family transcriptional regulator